jgi:S1-C subfamily serine protease
MTAGDVIVSVAGTTVSTASDLHGALDGYHPGDKVSIGWVDVSGQHHSATLQLIAGPPA